MYRAPEKESRSVFAIFAPTHDVMCCSCPFIQKDPIATHCLAPWPPPDLHPGCACAINRTRRQGRGVAGIYIERLATSNLWDTSISTAE